MSTKENKTKENKCCPTLESTMFTLHLECIKKFVNDFTFNKNMKINEGIFHFAAENSRLDILQYIIPYCKKCWMSIPRNYYFLYICTYACRGGSLECLKYLINQEFYYNYETASEAGRYLRLNCLQYLVSIGCEIDNFVLKEVVRGPLAISKQYRRYKGDNLSDKEFLELQYECFSFLIENGCKHNDVTLLAHQDRVDFEFIDYFLYRRSVLPDSEEKSKLTKVTIALEPLNNLSYTLKITKYPYIYKYLLTFSEEELIERKVLIKKISEYKSYLERVQRELLELNLVCDDVVKYEIVKYV
jgi:hypothetical protein